MATVTKDRVTVIDLDKENITSIDIAKKTYSVMTFAEMKQMMENLQQRSQNRKGQNDSNVSTNFKVSAKATGQTKTLQGLSAKEMILTIEMSGADQQSGQTGAMTVETDSWLAPVPGYEEVKAFHIKMGEKMGYAFGSGMAQLGPLGARPDVGKGFEEVAKEMAKLDGVPVQSVVKMGPSGGASGAGPAGGSSAQSQNAPPPPQQQADGQTPAAAALGRLTGLGGFGRKKKSDDQPSSQQAPADQQQASASSGSLMETTSEMTSFSGAPVDGSKFEIPAGFKQVQPDTRRGPQ
jgi:hypothetical protein